MPVEQNELLRHSVIEYLVLRRPAAFSADSIARLIRVNQMIDFEATADQCGRELVLLKDLGLVEEITDPLGSTRYHRATGKGVLETERKNRR